MELPKRPMTMTEYNNLKRKLCLSKQKFREIFRRRNTFGDRVELTDEILVYEGTGQNRKLKFASKGHIVNQGLIHIVNLLSPTALSYGSSARASASTSLMKQQLSLRPERLLSLRLSD